MRLNTLLARASIATRDTPRCVSMSRVTLEDDEGSSLLGAVSHRRRGRRRVASVVFSLVLGALGIVTLDRVVARVAYGVGEDDARVRRTRREYDGDGWLSGSNNGVREIRWTSRTGFYLVGGDGRFVPSWFGKSNFETKARDAVRASVERYYPGRLAKGQKPFSVLFITSDAPFTPCLDEKFAAEKCPTMRAWSPIFAFGSAPRDWTVIPSLVRAPLVTLTDCYVDRIRENATAMRERGEKYDVTPSCGFLNYVPEGKKYAEMARCVALSQSGACAPYQRGLFTIGAVNKNETSAYEWEHLIPKVFWRGNDFEFLWSRVYREGTGKSDEALRAAANAPTPEARRQVMMECMTDDRCGPRVKAVFMSILDPDFIDAKYFDWGNFTGSSSPDRQRNGKALGVDAAVRVTEEQLGKYKYQIDIGGAGGTTYTGTISKLSMPGVLLHHETATVDSYHHSLIPWVHYVPVSSDLSDLRERVRWIEEHPEKAKQISDEGTRWTRWFRNVTVLLEYNKATLVKPLAAVVDPAGQFYVE